MNRVTLSSFSKLNNGFIHICKQFYSSRSECQKICIIGSGPAGFYTAQHLLKKSDVEVDIYEKLPVPFGLIRYGVAPDHPEIKVVTNAFSKIAQHEKCTFFGNVFVGCDVKVSELLDAYDGVVLAFGACKDNELEIPGEDSPNVFAARKFVNWYNGHPDHVNDKFDLDTEVAVVVGHGNVALDVARILLKNTDELKTTDIAQHAMDTLLKSKIKKVVLIGRRGPLQVSFTIKELREIINLEGCSTVMSPKDFDGIKELIPNVPRHRKRLIELLYNTAMQKEVKKSDKTLEIKFFRSPQSIISENGKARKIVLGVNTVDGTAVNAQVVSTREKEEVECGLILRSVGYKSLSIDPILPFDSRKYIVPNVAGRVIDSPGSVWQMKNLANRIETWPKNSTKGLYCSGWVKTGPYGVILSTMNGSFETAEKIIEDMDRERQFVKPRSGQQTIVKYLRKRGIRFTTFNDWLKIDKVELERGKAAGKAREKVCDIEEMLKIAGV